MIQTERLNIYPATNDQMLEMIAEQSLPELKAAYSQMLSGCTEHPDKREWYAVWNIALNDGINTVVGYLSFKGPANGGAVELGYGMNPEFEGRGYMTEAVTAVTLWAVARDGVLFVEAETEEDNLASQSVLEKSGFVKNGKTGDEGPRYVFIP